MGFRNALEAAFITVKRPKPSSDIEEAMTAVNKDVRDLQRDKQNETVSKAAGRESED